MNILLNTINISDFDCMSSCETMKEIWDKLYFTYEQTLKVKYTKITILVSRYELI